MSKNDDWEHMLEQEDGELYCISLIEEIIQKSQQVLFEKRIDIQVLPFATAFCKEVCLELVSYKFFKHDPGNDLDMWEEDEEFEGQTLI